MKPEDRKRAIAGAAVSCFAERGYHATQISDIIARAGVARGTFYLYFKSKHEIFNAILDEFIETLKDQIKTIALGAKKSPAEQMRANVERVIDLVLGRPEIGKFLFNEAVGLDREIDDRLRLFYDELLSMIEASLSKGIAFGLVRKVDPRIASCIVLGGFRELLIQGSIFKTARIGRKAMVDGLIDVLLGGLSGKPVLG